MCTFTSLVSTGLVQRDFLQEEGKGMVFRIFLVNTFLLKLGRFLEIAIQLTKEDILLPHGTSGNKQFHYRMEGTNRRV